MSLQDAVRQIEAVLTPKEARAVISINADLLLHYTKPFVPPDAGPGVGPGPAPPPGAHVVFAGNTAGLALLELNLNPNQMQLLYARPPR